MYTCNNIEGGVLIQGLSLPVVLRTVAYHCQRFKGFVGEKRIDSLAVSLQSVLVVHRIDRVFKSCIVQTVGKGSELFFLGGFPGADSCNTGVCLNKFTSIETVSFPWQCSRTATLLWEEMMRQNV